MGNSFSVKNFFELIFFCALALIPRLILLNENQAGIESDEAIIGLMAKHILEGRPIPIFYYGQNYMGSLEALFTVISFKLFGISNLSLKIVPLFFSVLLVGINYYFGFILQGKVCARISALFTSLAPSPLIVWSLKARGGFIETVVIGSLCLLFTAILLKRRSKSRNFDSTPLFFLTGFLAGLGWWTNNQIIFYYPAMAYGLLLCISQQKLKNFFKSLLTGLISFFLGSAPFWYHNLAVKPKWSTFEVLFGKSAGSNKLEYLQGFFDTALPIILGARKFWASSDIFPGASFYTYLIYFLVIVIGLLSRPYKDPRSNFNRSSLNNSIIILVIFLITVPIIFSLSSFGWLSQAPRYLLPLYSVIPVLIAYCLTKTNFRPLRTTLLILILMLNLASNYLGGIADEGQPMLYKGQRVSKDHSQLHAWLKDKNYTHVYTNYWIGYRLAFETKEDVTFSIFGTPRTIRIPEYELKADKDFNNKVFVLPPFEALEFMNWLNRSGHCAKIDTVGDYKIIHEVKRRYPSGKIIPLSADQFRSFIPPANEDVAPSATAFKNLIDGDLESRWGSGRPQKLGMAIEIDLKSPQTIHRIVLKLGNYTSDAPRLLNVSGFLASTQERVQIFSTLNTRVSNSIDFYEVGPEWDIRFNALNLSTLRLELIGDTPVFDWSIAELELYSPEGNINELAPLC